MSGSFIVIARGAHAGCVCVANDLPIARRVFVWYAQIGRGDVFIRGPDGAEVERWSPGMPAPVDEPGQETCDE